MGSAALKLKKTVSKVKVIIPQVCAHCLMGLGWACGVGVIVARGKLEISRTYFGNGPLPAALTRSAWLFGWQRMARRNWSRESLGCWLTPPYTELSSAPSVSPTCTQVQRAEEHSVHSHRAELETGWIWELTWGSPPHAHQPLGSHFPSLRGFSRVWWLLLIDWLIDWLILRNWLTGLWRLESPEFPGQAGRLESQGKAATVTRARTYSGAEFLLHLSFLFL